MVCASALLSARVHASLPWLQCDTAGYAQERPEFSDFAAAESLEQFL
jgi:hypothetical protein